MVPHVWRFKRMYMSSHVHPNWTYVWENHVNVWGTLQTNRILHCNKMIQIFVGWDPLSFGKTNNFLEVSPTYVAEVRLSRMDWVRFFGCWLPVLVGEMPILSPAKGCFVVSNSIWAGLRYLKSHVFEASARSEACFQYVACLYVMIYGSKVPNPSPTCILKARRSLAAAFPTWDTGASPWVSYGPSRARRIGRWPSCTRRHPGITLRWRRSVSWSSRRR